MSIWAKEVLPPEELNKIFWTVDDGEMTTCMWQQEWWTGYITQTLGVLHYVLKH